MPSSQAAGSRRNISTYAFKQNSRRWFTLVKRYPELFQYTQTDNRISISLMHISFLTGWLSLTFKRVLVFFFRKRAFSRFVQLSQRRRISATTSGYIRAGYQRPANQLVLPLCCKSFSPLMQRPDRFRIRPIEHMPPVSSHPDQPDIQQHP